MGSGNRVVVVIIDGLRAAALGAYGQTAYPTPGLDRIAVEGTTHDWLYAPTPNPADLYAELAGSIKPPECSRLATDDSWPLSSSFAERFATATRIDLKSPDRLAESIAQTHTAAVWGALADDLQALVRDASGGPLLWWGHARGLYGPWDAPSALADDLIDEEDPRVEHAPQPPEGPLPGAGAEGQDARLAAQVRYAAQVRALDACLDGFVELADEALAGAPWRLVLAGARGFALGEHGDLGGAERLFSEVQHAPLLVRDVNSGGHACGELFSRDPALRGLAAALTAAVAGSPAVPQGPTVLRSAAGAQGVLGGFGERRWFLRRPAPSAGSRPPPDELYVKPDDRWEQNDVAKLAPDASAALAAVLDAALPDAAAHGAC